MVSKVSKVPKPSGVKENLSTGPRWMRTFFPLPLDTALFKGRVQGRSRLCKRAETPRRWIARANFQGESGA